MLTPFLQYVSEARIVRRQDDLSRYTYQEIEERVFISLMALAFLNKFGSTKSFAKQYANNTLTYGGFERVRTTANDLHNMMAVLDGDKTVLDKLANKQQAKALRQRHILPTMAIKRYLRTFKDDYKLLTTVERSLAINNTDYKNLRLAIADFADLNTRRKKVTVTRLLQAMRSKLAGTDLLRQVDILASQNDFELDNVVDAERTTAPTEMTADELNAYRILVGPTNVRRAKLAVEQASQGKGLAGPLAASYYPIMQMMDDIAKGGYTFVKLFQTIADRAKKAKK